jgi:tetratricopeptide (TPR) repeat protein
VPLAAVTALAFGLINSSPGPTSYLPPPTEEHLAIVAFHRGRSELAEDLMVKAIGKRERYPRGRLQLASIYESRGEIDKAVQALKSIEDIPGIDPDWKATAHSSAARALAKSGRAEEAIPHWLRVVEIDPDSSYHQGEPYFHLGLGHFIRRHAWFELGRAMESLGRLEEAAAEYRAHLQVEPHAPEVLGRLALTAVELEEFEEAVDVMRRYLEIQPEDGSAYDLLGVALEGVGDLAGAEDAYRRCLDLYPTYASAHLNLADLYVKTDRPAEARSILESFLERSPGHEEALRMLHDIR